MSGSRAVWKEVLAVYAVKITTDPDAALLDGMLRAIETQRQNDTWLRGYIPNPATWLNQRRWED